MKEVFFKKLKRWYIQLKDMKINKQCYKGIYTQSKYKEEKLHCIKIKNLCSLLAIIRE